MTGPRPSIAQILSSALNTSNQVATVNWQDPLAGLGSAGLPAPTPFGQVRGTEIRRPKNSYSEQWNFGVERQFDQNTVLTANYVGSQSHRLTVGGLFNVALPPGPGTPAQVAARQPFPYIGPTFYDRSVGNSSYNAFQFSVNHQASGRDLPIWFLTLGQSPLMLVALGFSVSELFSSGPVQFEG